MACNGSAKHVQDRDKANTFVDGLLLIRGGSQSTKTVAPSDREQIFYLRDPKKNKLGCDT